MTVRVVVLGNVGVERGGASVALGGSKQRLLLAVLAAANGRSVSSDALCEALWGNEQPATASATVQSHVSRLRRALRPEIQIGSAASGYSLAAPPECVDANRFELALAAVEQHADRRAVCDQLGEALSWWRGPAYGDLADNPWVRAEAARLDELRLSATEQWIDARLEAGSDATLVGDLERLVSTQPLRERFWCQLMIALHRSGRQGEALRRAADFAGILRDELGLGPSPAVRSLESRILADDPDLRGSEPAAPTARRTHFSDAASRLIGRDGDLERLHELVSAERVVTLVGPGGVGKTRLARRIASDSRDFAHPAALVELAAVRDPASIAAAVATALDVQQRQHLTIDETLLDVLSERHQLVVLDNCEHLIESAAALARTLTAACPRLHLLMTSREPVAIPGEVVFVVAPLAISSDDEPGDLSESPAVELFLERAKAARSGFTASAELLPVISRLCRRLDGLPLAIELATVRLRSLSPAGIIERLDHRFELLSSGDRAGDQRHRSLQNLVEWSYLLLTPDEQQLFSALSVFAGSFNLQAVDSICADGHDVSGVLFSLVDKSMVQVTDFDEPRYQLLETMGEFGRRCLAAGGDTDKTADSHLEWFVQLAEHAAVGLDGADERAWIHRVERDFDNLRAAHRRAMTTGDVDAAVRLVAALGEFAFRRINYELTGWAAATADMEGAARHPLYPVAVATVAYGHFVRGDLDAAIATALDADTAATRLRVPGCGLAERTLSNAYFFAGEVDQALSWMDRMIASARASGSPARLAHALYMRSIAETTVGRAVRSGALAGESQALARASASPTAMAQAACALGIALESTEPAEARQQLQLAAQFGNSCGNRWIEAFARTELLWQEARAGHASESLAGFASVIETWYRGGDWANQWLSLRYVCGIFHQLGDHEAAAVVQGALRHAGVLAALPFGPADAHRLQADVEQLRVELGPNGFTAAAASGASLSDSALVTYVLARVEAFTRSSSRACDP